MRHEWERGMTADTQHGPAEGYSYCAYCGASEDDDNTDAECEMRFGFRPLVFDREDYNVKSAEGDAPVASLYTASDFEGGSEADDARYDREQVLYGQLFAAAPDLLSAVKDAAPSVCSYLCPSVWREGETQPHSPLCERMRAAIERAEYDPFCEECGGSGEVEYGLPGFPLDTEQVTEAGECEACAGTGFKPENEVAPQVGA